MTGEPGVPFVEAANHWTGREGQTPAWIIVHGTAGFTTAQDVAVYFADPNTQASAHYVIGMDGTIIQCVDEEDAAWSNGPISGPPGTSGDGIHHDPWWDSGINPNLRTIAVEHVKSHTDNSDTLTDAQKLASFHLQQHICQRWQIPMHYADATGGIIGHYSMDPVNRSRCPGPYPWDELETFLKGSSSMIPIGWKDNPQTGILTAPNGVPIVKGFREYILQHGWDANNWPLVPEQASTPLEMSNPGLGGGTRQIFRWKMLEWTQDRGVFEAWVGQELLATQMALHQYTTAANITQVAQALNALIALAAQIKNDGDTITTAAQAALKALGQ